MKSKNVKSEVTKPICILESLPKFMLYVAMTMLKQLIPNSCGSD